MFWKLSVVIAEERRDYYHEEFDSEKSPSGRVAADFGRPDRNDTVDGTDTYSSNHTGTAHPGNVVRTSLQNRTEESPHASENDSLDSTRAVCQ